MPAGSYPAFTSNAYTYVLRGKKKKHTKNAQIPVLSHKLKAPLQKNKESFPWVEVGVGLPEKAEVLQV